MTVPVMRDTKAASTVKNSGMRKTGHSGGRCLGRTLRVADPGRTHSVVVCSDVDLSGPDDPLGDGAVVCGRACVGSLWMIGSTGGVDGDDFIGLDGSWRKTVRDKRREKAARREQRRKMPQMRMRFQKTVNAHIAMRE